MILKNILLLLILATGVIIPIRVHYNDLNQNLSDDFTNEMIKEDNNRLDSLERSDGSHKEERNKRISTNGKQVAALFMRFQDTLEAEIRYYNDRNNPNWEDGESELFSNIMGNISEYWRNVSYQTHTISYEIGLSNEIDGRYTLANNKEDYDFSDGRSVKQLMEDCVLKAESDNFDFTDVNEVIIWIPINYDGAFTVCSENLPFFQIDLPSGSFDFSIVMLGENFPDYDTIVQNWGRAVHGMGHDLGLYHTHEPDNSPYSLMANILPRDTGINPSGLTTFSQEKVREGVPEWYDVTLRQAVLEPGFAKLFHVRPRYLDLDSPNTDIQSIKVKTSAENEYYLVEIIEGEDEDKWLANEHGTGVLIYHHEMVEADPPDSGVYIDKLTDAPNVLYNVEDVSYSPPGSGITFEFQGVTDDIYDIRINNNAPLGPDLSITPWGAPSYETPDIWVDSSINGYVTSGIPYDSCCCRYTVGRTCDDPWIDHENRLYARIYNKGSEDANGVKVTFKSAGMTAGATGWSIIDDTETNPKIVDIPSGESRDVYANWIPDPSVSGTGIISYHGCVRVEVSYTYDLDISNNIAQENIIRVEVTQNGGGGSSISDSVSSDAFVFYIKNPFETTKDIYVNIVNLTEGWNYNLTDGEMGEFYELGSMENRSFEIVLSYDNDSSNPPIKFGSQFEAEIIVAHVVHHTSSGGGSASNNNGEMLFLPFGGISIRGTVMYISQLEISVSSGKKVVVNGSLTSPDIDDISLLLSGMSAGEKTIFIEIINKDTNDVINRTTTVNDKGFFSETFSPSKTGDYIVRAFYGGSNKLTSAISKEVPIFYATSWYLPVSLLAIMVIIISKRRKKLKTR